MIDTLTHTCKNIEPYKSIWNGVFENSIIIIVALIAGSVALFQVKSNIISTARIKWIESLRISISELYAAALKTALIQTNRKKLGTIGSDEYNKYVDEHSKFFILSNRIKMQLNIKEDYHKQLEELINKVEIILDPKNKDSIDQDNVELELKEIVKISSIIFKNEWDKSKRVFTI